MGRMLFLNLVIAGIISGITSFVALYFILLSRKNSIFYRALKRITEEVKDEISQIRDDIAPPGEVIQGIIDSMRLLNESDAKLHMFYGLKEDLSREQIFQDFKPDSTNTNCIHYAWFDAFSGSEITANVDQMSENFPFLNVKFDHRSNLSSPNVAIRPQDDKAVDNSVKRRFLSFEARISPDFSNKILLGIRVVNGWLQHWQYATRPNEYILISVTDSEWQAFSIDLDDQSKWNLFDSDGNRFYISKSKDFRSPDFRIITDVIFEVGILLGDSRNLRNGRPGEGDGSVDIREIYLRSEPRGKLV